MIHKKPPSGHVIIWNLFSTFIFEHLFSKLLPFSLDPIYPMSCFQCASSNYVVILTTEEISGLVIQKGEDGTGWILFESC
jgi:hypothetical protein